MTPVRSITALILLPAVAGCLSSAPKAPTYWTIDLSRSGPLSPVADKGTSADAVRIVSVDVRAPYSGQRLAVWRPDGSIAFDSFNTFASAPVQLLKGAAHDAVVCSGKFARVVSVDSLAQTPYSLEVTVTALALDCRTEGRRAAHVALSVQLVRARTVVASAQGTGERTVTGDYSSDFSAAFADAMRQALGGLSVK